MLFLDILRLRFLVSLEEGILAPQIPFGILDPKQNLPLMIQIGLVLVWDLLSGGGLKSHVLYGVYISRAWFGAVWLIILMSNHFIGRVSLSILIYIYIYIIYIYMLTHHIWAGKMITNNTVNHLI
ncbi:hypothetical protein ACJX0J_010938 [Zea mays]